MHKDHLSTTGVSLLCGLEPPRVPLDGLRGIPTTIANVSVGSRGGDYEVCWFLRCHAVQTDRSSPADVQPKRQ
jgi:hypothetical protein